ncbi:MAG: efflux RND transporter periplasmic adaptor subunit [bacterium]|nr:efflux RND transporter periplasmic adaptor subunit [Candidatus Sumerlaeota bacterium]
MMMNTDYRRKWALLDKTKIYFPANHEARGRAVFTTIIRRSRWLLFTACCLLALTACSRQSGGNEGADTPRSGPQFPVKLTTVASRSVEYEVETVGSLVEENLYKIPAQVIGTAQNVAFAEGDIVTTGQELCRIDYERYRLLVDKARNTVHQQEAAVRTAEAELVDTERKTSNAIEAAHIDLELAEAEYRRRASLTQGAVISEEDRKTYQQKYRRAELLHNDAVTAGKTLVASAAAMLNEKRAALDVDRIALSIAEDDLNRAIVRAPISGVIQERTVVNGQYLTLGYIVATMVNTNPLRLRFTVPESKSAILDKSMRVLFRVAAFPNRVFNARIYDIGAVADPASREIACWARADNPGYALRPGYFAKVKVLIESKKATVVVPLGCVQPTEAGLVCWILKDGKAEMRKVQTGVQVEGDAIEILSGVSTGEKIVTEGATALQNGVTVKIIGQQTTATTATQTTSQTQEAAQSSENSR